MEAILPIVDMIAAKLATIAVILVVLKFVLIRTKMNRITAFFQRIHRPVSYFILFFALLHGVSSLHAFQEVDLFVYFLGLLSFISVLATIGTHVIKEKLDQAWLKWHRIFTVITLIILAIHLIFGFIAYFSLK